MMNEKVKEVSTKGQAKVNPKPEEKPNSNNPQQPPNSNNPQPTQKPQTEEESFMSYMNQLISTVVLDNEAIKTKTVEAIKALGQQLGIYMREVNRLKEELDKLKNPKKEPEPKK